jgi:hypothetical protein
MIPNIITYFQAYTASKPEFLLELLEIHDTTGRPRNHPRECMPAADDAVVVANWTVPFDPTVLLCTRITTSGSRDNAAAANGADSAPWDFWSR